MSLKTGLNLTTNYSINFSLPKRTKKLIKFIILHYTGMKKESEAIKKLCHSKSKVSSNYFIQDNGKIICLVPELYKAWHAGRSNWKGITALNSYSVGISFYGNTNSRTPSAAEVDSVAKKCIYLMDKFNIALDGILTHAMVSPGRKNDTSKETHSLVISRIKELT